MTEQQLHPQENRVTRRSFISTLSTIGLSLSGLIGLFANFRYLKPNVEYGMDKVFRVGTPQDYKEGTLLTLEKERVVVIRDKQGFAAISLICTHLGCTVRPSSAGFECPCHGSQFNDLGVNTGGPAPRPLAWYRINLAPNGELEVDKGVKLPIGTYFNV